MPLRKYVYNVMLIFSFVGVSVIEIPEFNKKKCHIKSITLVLQVWRSFLNNIIINFQYDTHFDVSRSQIEWNLKVKCEISVCIYSYKYVVCVSVCVCVSTTILGLQTTGRLMR